MRLVADYQKPIVEALVILEDTEIAQFPVSLDKIQRQYKNLFQICSYGRLMKELGISRAECSQVLGSTDGAAVSQGTRYVIYYNELLFKQRIRFTIAHEMGHIFLDHHHEYGEPILDREGVGQQLYRRLENEANCFARNLLCPAFHSQQLLVSHGISRVSSGKDGWVKTRNTPITENLNVIFYADTLIENAFNVSAPAAAARIGFLNADMNKYRNNIDWKPTSHIKQTASWFCSYCGLERLEGALYCSECGRSHFAFQVNNQPLQYHKAKVNDAFQFSPCSVCGNKDYSEDAGFCKICGTPLSNTCTQDATHLNHPESKYCYVCGKPTSFKDTTHLIKVKENLAKNIGGDFPMIYESKVEYDRDTFRVKECPRCHNEIFSDNANYCHICGLELVNICIPEPVEDDFGNTYDQDPHNNTPDARFCEQCGAPTVYFKKHELLRSYEDIWKESDEEQAWMYSSSGY